MAKPQYDFTPKNGNDRTVPLAPELAALLSRMPQKGTVFRSYRNALWLPNNMSREWSRVVNELELPPERLVRGRPAHGVRLHELRHTYASMQARAGVDIVTLMYRMGHASITTTQQYLHAFKA